MYMWLLAQTGDGMSFCLEGPIRGTGPTQPTCSVLLLMSSTCRLTRDAQLKGKLLLKLL
jgi:hypothetical protein